MICDVCGDSIFFKSTKWKEIRYAAIEKYGRTCMACGSSPIEGWKIHVDHIKPRSKYPDLSLDINNLQILCDDCNMGKKNKFETDWRPKKESINLRDF